MKTIILLSLFATQINAQEDIKVTKPVPVVKPPDSIKAMDVTGDPPVANEDSALMPSAFIKNRVENMPVGTRAYVGIEAVKCDGKRHVWIDPDQLYGVQTDERKILVFKDAQGYHLIFEKLEHQWVGQELPGHIKWMSVKTITAK